MDEDVVLICCGCRSGFLWTVAQQAHPNRRNTQGQLVAPSRCPECAAAIQRDQAWWDQSRKVNQEREASRRERTRS